MGVNRALNCLLRSAEERSGIGLWKLDGVGTCAGVTKIGSEAGFVGPAGEVILEYRKNAKLPPPSRLSICPYFEDNRGCTIPDLKAPICAAVLENHQMWKEKFGIDGVSLNINMIRMLHILLYSDQAKLQEYFPEIPTLDGFYDMALDTIGQMTVNVRRHPVIYPFKNLAK